MKGHNSGKRRKQAVNTKRVVNRVSYIINLHTQKEQRANVKHAELGKGFAKHNGPFVRALDEALISFNVR